MMTLEERKWELRAKVLSERMLLSKVEWQVKSEKIHNHFMQADFYKAAQFIHCFVSINARNEVNTWMLISKMLSEGKEVAVPIMDFSETSLIHSKIDSLDNLIPNKWGIHEPQKWNEVHIKNFDLIIVPMAAADKKGNRLGYGKGFYDRFLPETEALKVGFVFSEFIFEEIPAEHFDINMDVLISEKGIISTQQ